jgi:hypothetical protein
MDKSWVRGGDGCAGDVCGSEIKGLKDDWNAEAAIAAEQATVAR